MRVIIPGTFDPFTRAHEELVKNASYNFGVENIYIEVLCNFDKESMFTLQERLEIVKASIPYINENNINGSSLTINKIVDNHYQEDDKLIIVRGLRNSIDLEYEKTYSDVLNLLGISIYYQITSPENSTVSSTLVRNLIKMKTTQYKQFVSSNGIKLIEKFTNTGN